MLTCFFCVPGCGKTTLLTKFAISELRKIEKGKSPYTAVYTNFYVEGCNQIDFALLEKYKLYDCLIILDEITLDADNRKFKDFTNGHRDYFILHRHIGNDIIYATQSYETVDLKIRQLTQELWYMSKTVVPFLSNYTTAKRIYRKIDINEHTSELKLGYRFCNLIESFFVSNFKLVYRPFYYRYFDSFDENALERRPVLPAVPWTKNRKHSYNVGVEYLKAKKESICAFFTKLKSKIARSDVQLLSDPSPAEESDQLSDCAICTNSDSERFKALFTEKLHNRT